MKYGPGLCSCPKIGTRTCKKRAGTVIWECVDCGGEVLRDPVPVQLRGIEQGAVVARSQSAPERPVAAQAAVKAHKAGAAHSSVSKQTDCTGGDIG